MPTSGSSPETPVSAATPDSPGSAASAASAPSAQGPEPTPQPEPGPRNVAVQLRTAPKIWPFLVSGAVVGAVVAFVVTWFSHADLVAASDDGTTEHSFASTFGFMFMIFAVVGMAVAGVIFLLIDRLGRRRVRTVDMVVEPVTDEGEDSSPVKE